MTKKSIVLDWLAASCIISGGWKSWLVVSYDTKSLTGLWLLLLWSAGLGLASYVAMTMPALCA